MNNTQQNNDAMIEAESAIRHEVTKRGLSYEELSPVVRELLVSVYVQGGINAIEKARKNQKELLENS